MVAIVGGLGAACCFSATAFFAQRASRVVGGWVTFAWASLVGAVAAAGPDALARGGAHLSAQTIALLALSGVLNVSGLVMEFVALGSGRVSVVTPIISAEGAVTALIAGLVGEPLAGIAWAALTVVVVGVIATCTTAATEAERRAGGTRRTVMLSLGSALAFGVGLYFQGTAGDDVPLAIVVAPPSLMGVLLVTLPFAVARRLPLPRTVVPVVVGVGLAELAGFWCFAAGATGSVAITAVLSSQFAVVSVVASVVILKERLTSRQLAGLAATCSGVAVLALSR
jgi:drug/metabolite transporter (DMT)-like permease